ncbi:MAG: hypothetical protein R3Y68_05625 [Rikenellaceae bacterium]
MINAAFDLLDFLRSNFSMIFALALYTALAVLLAKSIKKNYKVYYWLFGLMSAGFVIPVVVRLCGGTMPFNLGSIPLFGLCFSELSSAANFVHPVLIIIMYMGAFSPKIPVVGKLMSIRKELSIIVGFPVIAHAMKRLFGSFVGGWNFFFDHEAAIQSPRVTSVIGSGISSFVYVLGLVMFVLFLVLWITSFDSVHKKLGTQRWKSVQKWSYGLYAMLFIHAMGLNLGGYISDKAREAQQSSAPRTEQVERAPQAQQGHGAPQQAQPQAQQGHGHGSRPQPFRFSEIEIGRNDKRVLNMVILVLIYGSYLYFRLRKAKIAREKRDTAKTKK